MVVISDTSCLNALLQIGELGLLRALFNKIIIPPEVAREISQFSSFGVDLTAFSSAEWIQVAHPKYTPLLRNLSATLDIGESQAITLAVERSADWLIIDEWAGRKVAASLSIPFIGLAGVLLLAKEEGIIPKVKPLLEKILSQSSFRLSNKVVIHILKLAGEAMEEEEPQTDYI